MDFFFSENTVNGESKKSQQVFLQLCLSHLCVHALQHRASLFLADSQDSLFSGFLWCPTPLFQSGPNLTWAGLSLTLRLPNGLSWWCFHVHVCFFQCNPFSPNQPSHSNFTKGGKEEESNCGEDFATGFPSPAFLLPYPCLLKQEKMMYVFCSLLHYVCLC